MDYWISGYGHFYQVVYIFRLQCKPLTTHSVIITMHPPAFVLPVKTNNLYFSGVITGQNNIILQCPVSQSILSHPYPALGMEWFTPGKKSTIECCGGYGRASGLPPPAPFLTLCHT